MSTMAFLLLKELPLVVAKEEVPLATLSLAPPLWALAASLYVLDVHMIIAVDDEDGIETTKRCECTRFHDVLPATKKM